MNTSMATEHLLVHLPSASSLSHLFYFLVAHRLNQTKILRLFEAQQQPTAIEPYLITVLCSSSRFIHPPRHCSSSLEHHHHLTTNRRWVFDFHRPIEAILGGGDYFCYHHHHHHRLTSIACFFHRRQILFVVQYFLADIKMGTLCRR